MNETESFPSNKMEVTNTCPLCAKQRTWDEMTFITTQVHSTHGIQNCVICLCGGCKARSHGKQDSVPDPQNAEGVKSGSLNQNTSPQGWQQGAAKEIADTFATNLKAQGIPCVIEQDFYDWIEAILKRWEGKA